MAKILYAPGIEEVSGALSKINTKSKHRDDENMFLATHRKAATMNNACARAYYRKINKLPWQSGSVPSTSTLEIRALFASRQKAVNERSKDLAHVTADQTLFRSLNEQFKSKYGYYATQNAFYWAAAKKYTQDGRVEMPTGAIEMTFAEFDQLVRRYF